MLDLLANTTSDLTLISTTRSRSMPHFEWRVFIPASSSSSLPSELWSLIGLSPSRKEPERADVYLTCTSSAGLKLRDGKKVEIKLKESVSSPGESEAWAKVVRTNLPHRVNSKDPIAVGKVFQENLRKIEPDIEKDPGLKESLDNALSTLNDPQQFVTVAKTRIKTSTYRLSVESVEETLVILSVGKDPGTFWRTVCIEASKPEDIDWFLAMKVTPEGGSETRLRDYLVKSGVVQAYPEFIMQRAM